MVAEHIDDLLSGDLVGQQVETRGWVHRLRKQKDSIFLVLRDSTGLIQCVLPRTGPYNNITRESSVTISGSLRVDERAPGGYELAVDSLELIGESNNFPIGKDQSQQLLNDNRHLWIRSVPMQNTFKLRDQLLRSARDWFAQQGWYETSPPIMNKSAAEGGSTLFEVPFFNDTVYLSQSAQLYLEALTFSLGDVWSLTPSFRAEKSKTPRHLAEYWHLEGESAWATFDDILAVEENLITYLANDLAAKSEGTLVALGKNPEDLAAVKAPFERIPYEDVIRMLQRKGHSIQMGEDLGTEDERVLTQDSLQPVFVYGAPKPIKPFYTKVDPQNPDYVLSADMLAPGGLGEISTGGQREEDLGLIVSRLKEEGFDPKDYSWYLDIRRHGSVPHAGFGFGVERLMRWMGNLEHIRDAIPFPRSMARVFP